MGSQCSDSLPGWGAIDIFVFPNGHTHAPPRKYHLNSTELQWWDRTLNHLARTHYGVEHEKSMGMVKKHSTLDLYTLTGKKIQSPCELQNGMTYVAVDPNEKFIQAEYVKYLMKASKSRERREKRRSAGLADQVSDEEEQAFSSCSRASYCQQGLYRVPPPHVFNGACCNNHFTAPCYHQEQYNLPQFFYGPSCRFSASPVYYDNFNYQNPRAPIRSCVHRPNECHSEQPIIDLGPIIDENMKIPVNTGYYVRRPETDDNPVTLSLHKPTYDEPRPSRPMTNDDLARVPRSSPSWPPDEPDDPATQCYLCNEQKARDLKLQICDQIPIPQDQVIISQTIKMEIAIRDDSDEKFNRCTNRDQNINVPDVLHGQNHISPQQVTTCGSKSQCRQQLDVKFDISVESVENYKSTICPAIDCAATLPLPKATYQARTTRPVSNDDKSGLPKSCTCIHRSPNDLPLCSHSHICRSQQNVCSSQGNVQNCSQPTMGFEISCKPDENTQKCTDPEQNVCPASDCPVKMSFSKPTGIDPGTIVPIINEGVISPETIKKCTDRNKNICTDRDCPVKKSLSKPAYNDPGTIGPDNAAIIQPMPRFTNDEDKCRVQYNDFCNQDTMPSRRPKVKFTTKNEADDQLKRREKRRNDLTALNGVRKSLDQDTIPLHKPDDDDPGTIVPSTSDNTANSPSCRCKPYDGPVAPAVAIQPLSSFNNDRCPTCGHCASQGTMGNSQQPVMEDSVEDKGSRKARNDDRKNPPDDKNCFNFFKRHK